MRKQSKLSLHDKEFVSFLLDLGFTTSNDGKVVPEFVLKQKESFICAFLRGLFSADGNLERDSSARLTICDDNLRSQVSNLLLSIGIRTREHSGLNKMTTGKQYKFSNINTIDSDLFFDKVGFIQQYKMPNGIVLKKGICLNRDIVCKYVDLFRKNVKGKPSTPEHKSCLADLNDLNRKGESIDRFYNHSKYANIELPSCWKEYYFAKVTDINISDEEIDMFDVEVYNEEHAFVANGIVVHNSHRMPVIEADKMDFINTQTSNKDMEYSRFYDFMLLITSALYKIDPSEIGFKLSGAGESAPAMFEGNNEARLKFSKDKGLAPLLRYKQKQINKYIIQPLTEDYVFEFVGLDAETKEQEEERENKAVSTYKTVNEVRRAKGLKDIEGGDTILNPVFLQGKQMDMMGGQESNEAVDELDSEIDEQETENPFEKSLSTYWDKLMNEDK